MVNTDTSITDLLDKNHVFIDLQALRKTFW